MSPILRREVIGLLRSRRTFWLLTLAVAVSGFLPIIKWPEGGAPGPGIRNSEACLVFFWTMLTAAMIVVPALTASAIAGEHERGTHDLLFMSLVSPARIALSKAAAPLAILAVLIIGTLPAASSLHLLGGVGFASILKCYAVTFASIAASTAICLVQSLRSKTTAQAALRGVVWIALWSTGPFIVPVLACWGVLRIYVQVVSSEDFRGSNTGPIAGIVSIAAESLWRLILFVPGLFCTLMLCVPIAMMLVAAGRMSLALNPYTAMYFEVHKDRFIPVGLWIGYVIYALVVAAIHLVHLVRHAGGPESGAAPNKGTRQVATLRPSPFASPESAAVRPARRSLLTKALIAAGEQGTPVLRNPIFLKEVRTQFHGSAGPRAVMFWGTLAICAFVSLSSLDITRMCLPGVAIVTLLLPAIAATAFTREVEQGNLDALRGTLLSPWQIVGGKLLASIASAAGIAAACVGPIVEVVLIERPKSGLAWPALMDCAACTAVILITVCFVAALSLFASVVSRRSIEAVCISYLTLLTLYLGLPLLFQFAGHDGPPGLNGLSPFLTLDSLRPWHPRHGLFPWNLMSFFFLQGGIAIVLAILSCWWFARFRMRDR